MTFRLQKKLLTIVQINKEYKERLLQGTVTTFYNINIVHFTYNKWEVLAKYTK